MATLTRNPLATHPVTNQESTFASPWQLMPRKSSSVKRARSPEPSDTHIVKRTKALVDARPSISLREEAKRKDLKEPKEERERKRAEREEEFRVKYARAFPNWVFYFDLDPDDAETAATRKELERMVSHMNARVDDFFSKEVTHLVVMEFDETPVNKENLKSRATLLSPIKLKGRPTGDIPISELVQKALAFEMKIWTVDKLRSVLDRCYPFSSAPSASTATALRSPHGNKERLKGLLENERLHGTTERDPTQKRHDFIYFSKNSYFVLVEDMRQELATLIALEYPISRSRDGKEKGSWPVLYCHPLARGPFVEYDEREERKRVKAELADKQREQDIEQRRAELREKERKRRERQQARRGGDLRRTVSMHNIRRRVSMGHACPEGYVDLDADFEGDADSAAASGYLGSGTYVAASGNSVGITSTTGTTSTAGLSLRSLHLPPSLRGKLQQQIITSRKAPQIAPTGGKDNVMGPPPIIPDRPQRLLRKSRSTNTMRLPKRDEGQKPGYCESCRVKFEHFPDHVYSKKHRKFAEDDSNFASLDRALSRVRRRTIEEVQAERQRWDEPVEQDEDKDDDEDEDEDAVGEVDEDLTMTAHLPANLNEEDIQWDDWVDADNA